MSAESLALISAWFTVGQWLIISSLFLLDSSRVGYRVARQYRAVKRYDKNGRVLIAFYRRKISRWYIAAAFVAFILGLLATYQLIFAPDPPPQFRLIGSLIREGVIFFIFAVWRTKRLHLALQRLLDERTYEEGQEIIRDTNTRVREMQSRGLHDQPEEEADRKEGREHRSP